MTVAEGLKDSVTVSGQFGYKVLNWDDLRRFFALSGVVEACSDAIAVANKTPRIAARNDRLGRRRK